MEGPVVKTITRSIGLKFGTEERRRCFVECMVKEFRVRYNSAVVVAEKEKEIVKVNVEVVSIVSWQELLAARQPD